MQEAANNCLTDAKIAAFRQSHSRSTLAPHRLAHLEHCPSCLLRAPRARDLESLAAQARGEPAPSRPCLDADELAAAVNDELSLTERKLLETHCRRCKTCRLRVRELRQLVHQVRGVREADRAAGRARWVAQVPRAGWALAGALTGAVVVMVGAWSFVWAPERARLTAQRADLEQRLARVQDHQISAATQANRERRRLEEALSTTESQLRKTTRELAAARAHALLPREAPEAPPEVQLPDSGPAVRQSGLPAALQYQLRALVEGSLPDPRQPSGLIPAGGTDELQLRSPRQTWVRTARPEFRWIPEEGARWYSIVVFRRVQNKLVPFTGGTIPAGEGAPDGLCRWQPRTNLPRGEVYAWDVVASAGDKPLPDALTVRPGQRLHALFGVLSTEHLRTVEASLAAAGPVLEKQWVVLRNWGLRDEAEALFTRIQPGDKP